MTAAWNLIARSRRTHGLKHFGWIDVPTGTGTMWISPSGQITMTERYTPPPPPIDLDAELPDPDALHQLETELLRPPDPERQPPVVPADPGPHPSDRQGGDDVPPFRARSPVRPAA